MSQSLTNSNKNKMQVQVQEEEEDDLVILPAVDNSELIARFKLSLVGRLFNGERRSVETLIALLPRPSIWDVEGRVRGVDLGNQRFQFDFESEEDLQKVLSKRPCHFNKWSFALERWAPHIGDSFPNTMTFWVTVMGIPTHFWLDPIFRTLGRRLGDVGLVEEKTAKFQVVLNAELPLKFALRAQLPSGEIVPVSLEYVNLHRWCHSCRRISHEVDTCPLLTEEQREQFRLSKENNRDQGQQSRIDSNRKGDLSKRFNVAGQKPPSYLERRSGEGTQRDNRDSVWKRIDSRYAPRDDHRENNRQAPRDRDRDILPPSKETYNKRRYDDSFAASKHREETRRAERKHVPTAQSSKGGRAPEGPRDNKAARPSSSSKGEREADDPPYTQLEQPQPAKQIISSPDHVRERPFRLSLQKNSSGDLKLKGKIGDMGDSSESVSSAKKSLNFADKANQSPSRSQPPLLPVSSEEKRKKSWYEMTMEEEEEAIKTNTEADFNTHLGETELNEINDPNEDKILEEDDWIINGETFDVDDDDLMDEDELLYDENHKEEETEQSMDSKLMSQAGESSIGAKDNFKETKTDETLNRLGGIAIGPSSSRERGEGREKQSPSHLLQSPFKKKKGSPNTHAAGLSLRKRNMIKGRASPKFKEAKDGPPMGSKSSMGELEKMHGGGKEEALTKTKNKAAKVGSKPPKIPK